MRVTVLFCLSAMLLSSAASASEVKSYAVDLTFDPATAMVSANAAVQLKPEPGAKTLVFYLHDGLQVSQIRLGGQPLVFRQTVTDYDYSYTAKASRVEADTGGRDVTSGLDVRYSGRFSPSSARSPSDYMRGDQDGLYLRSYGYSLWFPIFAESNASFPATAFSRVSITAPKDFRAVFAGEETGREERDNWVTTTWKAGDVGPYDAQLTLRRFEENSCGGLKTYALKDAASKEGTARICALALKLVDYYSRHYRAKAAERTIHVLQEPKYGDIAGSNVIGLQDEHWRAFTADGTEAVTMAHELVHAFVQTPTRKDDRLFAFEIEGFPSYFHLPALGAVLGEAWYGKALDKVQARYNARRSGAVKDLPPEKPILEITPDEVGTYKDVFVLNDRALLFWDYLRRKMDRPGFDAMVQELTAACDVNTAFFFDLIHRFAPALEADVHLWLETSQYPQRFQRPG